MTTAITGVVTNGVVVPNAPLPDGTEVEIHVLPSRPKGSTAVGRSFSTGELRKMPRELRRAVLAAAAEMAEQDYREDKELTGFDAFGEEDFSEEERNDTESSSR